MKNPIVKTSEIAAIMLGRELTVHQLIQELEKTQGFSCSNSQCRIIRNVIANMCRSRNVDIQVERREGCDAIRRTHYFLRYIPDSYFRGCSLARRLKPDKHEVKKESAPQEKRRERVRKSLRDIHEINFCRLANAVDNALRGNGWVTPELLKVKKYPRHKKVQVDDI